MSRADGKAAAGTKPSGTEASDWPTPISLGLATFAADQHMIAFYEHQSHAVLNAFQMRRVGQLLSHAVKYSPWWQERLPTLGKGKAVSFETLPLQTRAMYRASLAAAGGPLPVPKGHGTIASNATSGSSGVAVAFFYSHLCGRMNTAHYAYDRTRQRLDRDRPIARIMSSVRPHEGPHVHVPARPVFGRNEEYQRRSKQFSIEEHARWIAEVRPGYVFASSSVLRGILDVFESGTVKQPDPPIGALMSFAETMTPEIRAQAQRVLGARVLDRYSCEEAGPLAFQCPVSDEHFHIAATNAIVEVLDKTGARCPPGKVGRVFVTNLHNYASPVVRHELGDLAAWAPRCVCGYQKPVLSRLLGRETFLIRLPSGERQYIYISAKSWLAIAPFQETRIVQVKEGMIRVECVLDRPLTSDERRGTVAMLEREITPKVAYEVVQLERIDWGPTYKRQDVVSLI